MFQYNHYVPVLKGKQGEFRALAKLSPKAIKNLTPLIDVPRISQKSRKALDKHLDDVAHAIISSWNIEIPFFVDLFSIRLEERTSNNIHPLTYLFQRLRSAVFPVFATPIIGLQRDNAYNEAVAQIIKEDSKGVCIRLLDEDLINWIVPTIEENDDSRS